MTSRDDLRFLSTVDTHHGTFATVPDRWFERSGFVTFSEQAQDGTPLVAVNLRYPEPCPLDATADMRIVHWLANLDVSKGMLARAFVRSIRTINAHMAEVGATRVWGVLPKQAAHLTAFLDRVASSGKCERVQAVDDDGDIPWWYYIGLGQDVTNFVRRP